MKYPDLNDYEIFYLIEEQDETASYLMYEKYMPIVYKTAKKFLGKACTVGLDFDDLKQEGLVALFLALKKYNPNEKVLFYTYATLLIERRLINLIKVNSSSKQRILNESVSINKDFDEDDSSFLSFIEDPKAVKPLNEMIYIEEHNYLVKKLFDLTIKEASALELRINGFKLEEISTLLSSNKRTICNVLLNARKKLKFNN